jgi:hypothetical protein
MPKEEEEEEDAVHTLAPFALQENIPGHFLNPLSRFSIPLVQMESAGFSPQDETIGCTSELREGRRFGAWNSVVNPVFSVAICKGTLLSLVLVAYALPKLASVGHQ